MRSLSISVGASRMSKNWINEEITFSDLCTRLAKTTYTNETVEEYAKFSKKQKGEIKDKGGFVGGFIIGKERSKVAVKFRSLITLDADNVSIDFLALYKLKTTYTSFIYSTHSHTPEHPRLRIIIPLTRDVSNDEYVAISRLFANEWGINQFDKCSFLVNQLMYWPTTPKNGEYIHELIDGECFDPDKYLSMHPNWNDFSNLPTTADEKKIVNQASSKQQDPLEKEGIIGAFCRTFSIQDAISEFLSDVYEESTIENRYTYKNGESTSGVIIYDNKFAYSHHATDPACGQLLNAFDLVRVHKFCNLPEAKSLKSMYDFASNNDKVKRELLLERRREIVEDFKEDEDLDWTSKLSYNSKTAQLENTSENLILILNNDSDFKEIAYNDFANQIQITGKVPWDRAIGNPFWLDSDTSQLKAIIDKKYLSFTTRNHDVAFDKVVHDRHFHPVRNYLNQLPEWDGIPRVDDLFINYFQAEDNDYVRAVTRKVFTAAVARIYEPGLKFDSIPVLDGEQGIGKSSIIKYLCGNQYFSDSLTLTDMNDKAGAEKLQGYWIIEIGELAGMKKADIEKVKSFISCTDDKYRASYGRVVENHPRQCVIFATVNGERGYLRDITGNRRFWVIKLHQKEAKWNWTPDPDFRDQFWAECVYRYRNGESLFLEGDVLEYSRQEQKKAMEVDERVGLVQEYLSKLLPDNWESMDLYARRNYLDGNDITNPKGTIQRERVCNAEIWCECFRKNLSDIKASDSYAITALMLQIDGWERQNTSRRNKLYGNQKHYIRKR